MRKRVFASLTLVAALIVTGALLVNHLHRVGGASRQGARELMLVKDAQERGKVSTGSPGLQSGGRTPPTVDSVPEEVDAALAKIREDLYRFLENPQRTQEVVELVEASERVKRYVDAVLSSPGNRSELMGLIHKADDKERALIQATLVSRLGSSDDPRVRRECLVCLVMFPDKAASILERSLRTDPDRGVRKVAAYALGTSGSAEQVDALYEAAKQDQGTPFGGDGRDLACVCISSLGSIGGARPAEALMRIWEDEQVRRGLEPVILTSLGTTGDLAVKPILEMAMQGDPALLRPCMIGFAELAKANPQDVQINRKAGDILRRGLGNADHRVRMIAATYLGFIGDRDDIGLLKGSLEDGYSETPSFVENGEERQRVCYPVQERAREAIERIRERLAREEQK